MRIVAGCYPFAFAVNGRGFEYPKGKTPRFGWAFNNMKKVKKEMTNYCKPYVGRALALAVVLVLKGGGCYFVL